MKFKSSIKYIFSAVLLVSLISPISLMAQRHVHHHRVVKHVKRHHHPRHHHRVVVHHPVRSYRVVHHKVVYHYKNGVFYRKMGDRFVKVMPPAGIKVQNLSSSYRIINLNGKIFYESNGVYFRPLRHGGFVVVKPPRRLR